MLFVFFGNGSKHFAGVTHSNNIIGNILGDYGPGTDDHNIKWTLTAIPAGIYPGLLP